MQLGICNSLLYYNLCVLFLRLPVEFLASLLLLAPHQLQNIRLAVLLTFPVPLSYKSLKLHISLRSQICSGFHLFHMKKFPLECTDYFIACHTLLVVQQPWNWVYGSRSSTSVFLTAMHFFLNKLVTSDYMASQWISISFNAVTFLLLLETSKNVMSEKSSEGPLYRSESLSTQ